VLTAIVASVLGGSLARRFGTKRVYLAGLLANLVSMVLLIVSQFFIDDQPVAYGLLLGATACLGAGFGLAVPALNTFTAVFHPAAVDRSILVLNALLGLGTALAPVFVAVFDGLGFWWGLRASTALASLALTTFWAMVTAGRVLFALVQRRLPTSDTYRILPFVLAGASSPSRCSPRARRRWACSPSGWPAWAARRCCR
jgi:MFS family permease